MLCCDNLPENGRVVRGVTLELARLIDPALADWIAAEGAFPSTMVDRIVPATKPEDIERLAALTGVLDLSPVMHEPFRQWVVEDHFVDGARPDLGAVGVQLVDGRHAVRADEAAHASTAPIPRSPISAISPATRPSPTPSPTRPSPASCRHLWRAEIIPTLAPPPGVDLAAYAEALFARYANPAIRHRTWQIAMDGSQKLPQRILGTIADDRAAGRPCPGLTLAVAAWMRYVGGVDERGAADRRARPAGRRA